jgi:hypothetical protein
MTTLEFKMFLLSEIAKPLAQIKVSSNLISIAGRGSSPSGYESLENIEKPLFVKAVTKG